MSSAPTRAAPIAGTRAWRSLGTRLAAFYVAVTVGSTIAVIALFAIRANAEVEREGQRNADSTLERYRAAFEAGGIDALRAVTTSDAGHTASTVRLIDASEVEELSLSSLPSTDALPSGRPRDWNVAVARVSQGRRLEVVVRNDVGVRLRAHAWEDVALIFGIGLASAIVGAFAISRRALRPVGELARATQRILESGNLALRVPEHGASDLDELTRLFNRMLARNESLVRAMRESLDNVAHDLRTPLTRLRAGAELALTSGDNDVAKARDALADTIEESDRVLAMLTTLMDIAEAEAFAMRLRRSPAELADIVREAVELYEHVSTERGVRVVTRLAPGVVVFVDRQRVVQVAANLLDNALKYTGTGGHVEVTVEGDEHWGVVSIADSGAGIASADQPHVWERLFRGDRSRTERGLGLGLSLVKAIVEAHGGVVELRSVVGEGSVFTVRLPNDKSAA